MSANISRGGGAVTLDRTPGAATPLTERDTSSPTSLVRIIGESLRDLAALRGRWWPHRIDFEDRTVDATGTTKYRFEHGFGARVRYWVVEWSGAAAPNLRKDAATDGKTLVLTSTVEGVATIRIEAAG